MQGNIGLDMQLDGAPQLSLVIVDADSTAAVRAIDWLSNALTLDPPIIIGRQIDRLPTVNSFLNRRGIVMDAIACRAEPMNFCDAPRARRISLRPCAPWPECEQSYEQPTCDHHFSSGYDARLTPKAHAGSPVNWSIDSSTRCGESSRRHC